jgi:hypothetical protein
VRYFWSAAVRRAIAHWRASLRRARCLRLRSVAVMGWSPMNGRPIFVAATFIAGVSLLFVAGISGTFVASVIGVCALVCCGA